ncbi:hypothetical protein RHGRI_005368 [Rhododendron griersonianum]|uniref:Uncharacterized protein n=1 Tax=Rhododendron griersonianum TaxID=479676 RepID=A0AAV6LC07_9ERIC|nr:hypothetical protein RHGRI_005368 [Rhododendron griersonianum]
MGLGLLAIQAHSSKLKPPPCDLFDPTAHCVKVGGGHAALLFGGLYLVAAGSAGIKASLPSHGADQFEEKDPKEAKQMSSFFNWFLLSGNIGTVISLTLVVWIQDNKGWDLGFGISSISMVVYVAAFRNRNLRLPEDPEDLYEIDGDKPVMEIEFLPHRDVYKFLDKAAIQSTLTAKQEKPNPWKLCRVTQVENAKIILGVLPIFCCAIIMTLLLRGCSELEFMEQICSWFGTGMELILELFRELKLGWSCDWFDGVLRRKRGMVFGLVQSRNGTWFGLLFSWSRSHFLRFSQMVRTKDSDHLCGPKDTKLGGLNKQTEGELLPT